MEPTPPIPAFVINLARTPERRALMADHAGAIGVALRFVDAVDYRTDAGAAAVDALPEFGPWGAFHRHDRACTLSHLRALAQVVEAGVSHALILEDDVFLAADLGAWLADAAWWPQGADIVKLERWRDDKLLVALDKTEHSAFGRSLRRMRSRHSGGAGYIVTRAAAQAILAAPAPNVPIDHLLFSPNVSALARRLVIHQVTPALVVQGNEPPGRPGSRSADGGGVRQSRWRKDLLRGWQEAKVFPRLLALWLMGRVTFERILWDDRALASGQGGET